MPKGYKIIDPNSSYIKTRSLFNILDSIVKIPSDKMKQLRRIRFIERRVDEVLSLREDYELFVKYYPQMGVKINHELPYYPIDHIIGSEIDNVHICNCNIQLGNSASLTNNHEYVFHFLSNLNLNNRKIIVPLSYSGKKKYKASVIKQGYKLFGGKLVPLLDFIPLEDYTKLMSSCSIAIYGNWRQEAIGNIIVSLYIGTKIFISNKNPLLEWAHRSGIVVFELEKITQKELDRSLTLDEKENNRNIIKKLNSDAILRQMRHDFEIR